MAIDYSALGPQSIPKGTPRVVDRIQKKRDYAKAERECRAAVKQRDKGRCCVPGCREKVRHLHHIQYRSQGGKYVTSNIASLCVRHHQLVHGGLIHISGNADVELIITGAREFLAFKL